MVNKKKKHKMPIGLIVLNIFLIITIVAGLFGVILPKPTIYFGMIISSTASMIISIISLILLTFIVVGFFKAKLWSWYLFIYYSIYAVLVGFVNTLMFALNPNLGKEYLSKILPIEVTNQLVYQFPVFLIITSIISLVIYELVTFYVYKKKSYFTD